MPTPHDTHDARDARDPQPAAPSATPAGPAPPKRESTGMPAEVQYLIIVVALFGLLLISGVPGAEVQEAGNGTGVLRQGWARTWSAQVAAEREAASGALPTDAAPGRDPEPAPGAGPVGPR